MYEIEGKVQKQKMYVWFAVFEQTFSVFLIILQWKFLYTWASLSQQIHYTSLSQINAELLEHNHVAFQFRFPLELKLQLVRIMQCLWEKLPF